MFFAYFQWRRAADCQVPNLCHSNKKLHELHSNVGFKPVSRPAKCTRTSFSRWLWCANRISGRKFLAPWFSLSFSLYVSLFSCLQNLVGPKFYEEEYYIILHCEYLISSNFYSILSHDLFLGFFTKLKTNAVQTILKNKWQRNNKNRFSPTRTPHTLTHIHTHGQTYSHL